jgi:hypothetical protein
VKAGYKKGRFYRRIYGVGGKLSKIAAKLFQNFGEENLRN